MRRSTSFMGNLILASALAACSGRAAGGGPHGGNKTAAPCTVDVHLVSWDLDYDSAQSEDDVIDPGNEDARHYHAEDCTYADEIQAGVKRLNPLESTERTTADVRLVAVVRKGSQSEMLSIPRMCDWIGLNRKRMFRFDRAVLELLMRQIPENERNVVRRFSSCSRPGG